MWVGADSESRYSDMGEVVAAFAAVGRRELVAAARRRNVVFAALMVFGLFSAVLAGREAVRAKGARDATEAALVQTEIQRASAQAAEAEAGRQRDRARHAQGLSEKLLNQLLYDLREQLEPLGKLELLDQVSKDAESYFAGLREDEIGPATERERSTMLNFRGDVFLAEGKVDEAESRFRESLAIRQQLLEAEPGSLPRQRDLSVCVERLAAVLHRRGEHEAAAEELRRVIEMRREIVSDSGKDPASRRDLGLALQKLGELQLHAGLIAAGERSLGESVAELQAAGGAGRVLAVALIAHGDALCAAGERELALKAYRDSIEVSEAGLRAAPEGAVSRLDLAAALLRCADLELAAGEGRKGVEGPEAWRGLVAQGARLRPSQHRPQVPARPHPREDRRSFRRDR